MPNRSRLDGLKRALDARRFALADRFRAAWSAFDGIVRRLEDVGSRAAAAYTELWRGDLRSRALAVALTPLTSLLLIVVLVTAAARLAGIAVAGLVVLLLAALAAAPVVALGFGVVTLVSADDDPDRPVRPAAACERAYPSVCIPPDAGDFDCPEGVGAGPYVDMRNFRVRGDDVHNLDGDDDGVGCES